jgi:tetratricopeptide (TPR) repeat protein
MGALVLNLAGCSVVSIAKGQYYLNQHKYEQGRAAFREELRKDPENARSRYYMGRLFLADDMAEKALPYLQEAVRLSSGTADYHFWLGVTWSALGNPQQEMDEYRTALKLNSRHVQARVYLGHALLEGQNFKEALQEYEDVLRFTPDHPAALYNRALCLRRLHRKAEEKTAWLNYLELYDTGRLAAAAADHLNGLDDFSYRNHILGKRTVTLKNIRFEPFSSKPDSGSADSLRRLGYFLTAAPGHTLHVLAYQAGNKSLARERALAVKKDILRRFPALADDRIRISWFRVPEKVTAEKKTFRLEQSINVFAVK